MGVSGCVIELHVEELILEGVDRSAGIGIAEALRSRLTALLTDVAPDFTGDASIARVAATPLTTSIDAPPQRLGAEIANSVHQSLVR